MLALFIIMLFISPCKCGGCPKFALERAFAESIVVNDFGELCLIFSWLFYVLFCQRYKLSEQEQNG